MKNIQGEVFHAGERAAQQQAGVGERLAELGPRVIRDHMPEQHREFFSLLPWLLIGSVDAQGQPWASAISGAPGFAVSPDAQHLDIRAQPLAADPLHDNLRRNVPVGILGLQPHTRRRNRMNGIVEHLGESSISVRVQQSFGNCPKYIQAREAKYTGVQSVSVVAERLPGLDVAASQLIANADTFFIATAHPAAAEYDAAQSGAAEGVDVSHRGGKPGFIKVSGNTLLVPDYTGNFFFNTIGNLLLEPRAGLLFVDFQAGDILQVSVVVNVINDESILAGFPGAQRLLQMEVTGVIRHRHASGLAWGDVELSPYLF